MHHLLMTRILATLALLVGALLAAPSSASAGVSDAAASCSTTELRGRLVTSIEWLSGETVRVANMRAGAARLFPGAREVVKPAKRQGERVTTCRVKANGTVVLRTNGGARIEVAQPVTPDGTHPARVGSWAGPVSFHSTLSTEWKVAEALAVWNTALPADRQLSLQAEPCSTSSCISITSAPTLTNPEWLGEAPQAPPTAAGEMTSCAIRVSDYAAAKDRLSVVAHEIGHCLGLPHWDYPGSIMYPNVTAGWTDLPSRYDLEWLSE